MGRAIALKVSGVAIIVQDMDDSSASRDLIDTFRSSISFHVVSWPTDKQPDEAFVKNTARAALIIPARFGRDMARGVSTPVQMLIDGSDSNTAKIVSGIATQIINAVNSGRAGALRVPPVEAQVRL